MFYNLNILNINKDSQVGNYIDDLVNLIFDINNKFDNNFINNKIVIDKIILFQKIFQTIDENNFGNEYELFFFNYFLKNKKDIEVKSFFGDKKIVFTEQYFQEKNFDRVLFVLFNI